MVNDDQGLGEEEPTAYTSNGQRALADFGRKVDTMVNSVVAHGLHGRDRDAQASSAESAASAGASGRARPGQDVSAREWDGVDAAGKAECDQRKESRRSHCEGSGGQEAEAEEYGGVRRWGVDGEGRKACGLGGETVSKNFHGG